jgi:hypothetical protein
MRTLRSSVRGCKKVSRPLSVSTMRARLTSESKPPPGRELNYCAGVSEFQGEQQKEKLKALRDQYFKDAAQTIQLEEEKDDFFRFKRPHISGRN